ncbi:hypothetical protein KJY73_16645 [Bowmanella sp. Y26]|uniref:FlgO family outer membrane protein n=1 Tax=Bowmanella yangjiangensis TaxID=2811230 RepID=UPI001BDD1C16|nr:FlgO family outer membrane protein [Bowmanella yangjiangensis]MBT1065221.1 hypothetical protein [Bowmanella yangjiangensis]
MKVIGLICALLLSASPAFSDAPTSTSRGNWATDGQRFVPLHHHKRLASYVEQMVMRLNIDEQGLSKKNIAVASFVDFDSTLTKTSMLGNQLAENFMQELRKQGFSVTESKSTGSIKVTVSGDIAYSRQAHEVPKVQSCCVLTGTIIYSPAGIEVNARLFDLRNNEVLASADGLIPYFVVSHLGQMN